MLRGTNNTIEQHLGGMSIALGSAASHPTTWKLEQAAAAAGWKMLGEYLASGAGGRRVHWHSREGA